MEKFTDFLNEQAQAKKGDWKGGSNMTPSLSYDNINDMKKDWVILDTIKIKNDIYFLFKKKDDSFYILGNFSEINKPTKNGIETKNIFKTVFGIHFTKFSGTTVYGDVYNITQI